MEPQSNNTVEFIKTCSQTYWTLKDFARELNTIDGIRSVDFNQSMYGPKNEEIPDAPVGFGWDIEVLYTLKSQEEIYTFEVTHESEWIVYAERSQQGENGLETEEIIFDMTAEETSQCIELLCNAILEYLDYCQQRVELNI